MIPYPRSGDGTGPILLKYRPLTVEAWQVTTDNLAEVATWCGGVVLPGRGVGLYSDVGDFVHAVLGAWVVKDVYGDFTPVSDRLIFAKTEAVIRTVAE